MKLRDSFCTGAALTAAILLSSCGSIDGVNDSVSSVPPPVDAARDNGVSDFPVKLGQPYQVGGQTYTPVDVVDYDDVGFASWYGQELSGKTTANGEMFNPDGISGAHRTLPLPSYVEVTALDTGKTILVRINDRGPFDSRRLIDLSQGAAQQLGVLIQGQAAVRVRRVNPPESERAALRAGRAIPDRLATPDSLLAILRTKLGAPGPVSAPVPVRPDPSVESVGVGRAADGGRFIVEDGSGRTATRPERPAAPVETTAASQSGFAVQIGAFSDKARADAMARKAGASVVKAGSIWRVRYGPFGNEAEAEKALASAKGKGYAAARILREP